MARVLLVDDEPALLESLGYALKRDGFSVDAARCLADAERQWPTADLVVLDLMLPDGSGFDLLVRLRRVTPSPAVIVLSSRDHEADRVAALETGADDYVTKPFSPREVVARVRAVLRRVDAEGQRSRSTPPQPPPAMVSEVRVDLDTRRATVGGRPLELTKVELDLLACMVEAPGRVFTRAQLIDRVWGDGFAITDRTIDSHMKALRRKIADAGADSALLETVRGVGYRLSDGSRLA
jgi:two-component system catabolic regulation response regulator CreB